jgi:hypothetical protein
MAKASQKQVKRVMEEFYSGKLRSRSRKKVVSTKQAKAIAMSEGRAASARGTELRTWRGRKRIRPKRKHKGRLLRMLAKGR